jgi:hypothetical protein
MRACLTLMSMKKLGVDGHCESEVCICFMEWQLLARLGLTRHGQRVQLERGKSQTTYSPFKKEYATRLLAQWGASALS